jgi:membrane-bound lytic murein transglycosylase B
MVAILLQSPSFSDFFGDLNNLLDVQASLITTVTKINDLKSDLLDQKDDLAARKSDAAKAKALQDAQRQQVAMTKAEKDQLLKETKGQEAAFQAIVAQKRADAAKIRNRIFTVLGGGQMTFEQAYNFAKTAEAGTGTPAAFLLAILNRESRLGANVGRCTYKTSMAPGPPLSRRDDVTPFLKITAELGLNPETTVVSCANADGAYGGAMGPSQFIPTTWMMYRDRISAVTGNKPANPWNNMDAFTGTALYLKDAMARCGGGTTAAGVRAAASAYYSGSCVNHAWTYGEAVRVQADQFKEDIAAISS